MTVSIDPAPRRVARWLRLAALAGIYVLAGKIGLSFAFVHVSASPVWPPAGIALAALLVLGPSVWPAIFAGAFLVNVMTAGSVATSLGIATGNTLEAWLGAWLVSRYARGARALDRAPDVFRFVVLAALVPTTVSATLGVSSLSLGGYAGWQNFGIIWLTWWLGDAAGVLIVAPLVLLWSGPRGLGEIGRRPLEAGLLLLSVLGVGEFLFGGALAVSALNYPLAFLEIPPLLWAAFRFGPRGAATAVALLAVVAIRGTLRGEGPFAFGTVNASLLVLQGFMSTIGATMLAVAAVVWDRKSAEDERAALLAREQTARAEAEERRRVSEEMARVARSLTETLDVAAVGERLVQAVLDLFAARAAGLRLLASDGSLIGVAFSGGMRDVFPLGHVVPAGAATVSGIAVAQAAPAWTEDAFADPRLQMADDVRRGMASVGNAAVLAVPLRVKGQIIGALSIADRRGRRFTSTEADLLQAFADQGAVAVENARLYEEATHQRRESDVIAALAAEINRSLEPDRVLQQVAAAAAALCDADFARIALSEPGSDAMTFRFTVGTRVSLAQYRDVRIEPGKGLSGSVIATGRPYRTSDLAQDPGRLAEYQWLVDAEGSRSVMIVPIVSEGKVGGLVYVHRRTLRPFTDRDETVGLRLADQAAIAIRNSHLFAAERAARAEAHAADRAKDHFLATLSHELRTPLNAMIGWLRMLRNPRLDDARRAHALEVIERNARLQAQLINDLLDVSRIIAGKVELERYPLDLVPVVQEAIDAVRSDVEAKTLTLAVDLDPATGEILGDPMRLQQVVTNLVSNAVKFTPPGGRIEVRLTRVAGHARLRVEDTGEGIAPDVLPYVFEPFHQADSSTTRVHQGLGLGLAIVRQIVELHGGRVQAESAGPGRGATLTVDLPIIAIRGPRARTWLSAAAAARLDGLRVLVVDDEADAREVVALVLAEAGAEVATASSTADALEVMARTPIDVLVSDLAMPGADGYDLIMAVRARERGRPSVIRAVALTAYASRDVRERVLAAGFTAYATKPLDPEDLVDLIAKLSRK